MNNYNNFFSSSQFFNHDDLNWATTDPYNLFDESMLGSSLFYNPIYGYDNQLLLQSSFPFFEDDVNVNKDTASASSGNYMKDKPIQKTGAPLAYSGNSNTNLYCQPTPKKPTTQTQPQSLSQPPQPQLQSQPQPQQPQPQYVLNRADSTDTIFSCISQGNRYDSTEQLQRGGMVRADLSQYDLLYDSENSSSKHYIPTANPRDWSIFDQPRENFFNSLEFDYDFGESSNSVSLGMDTYNNINDNSMPNYNLPLTIDPSTIICNNNTNIKLEVEDDDPIIRSILCSESEEEDVYEEEENDDKKQKQLQQIQQSNLINSNKILSDSEDDDDDDDDADENIEDDVYSTSLFQKNGNIYNKNGTTLDLINTNIANKKNDLSIFTYDTNYSKKNEYKNKLSKDNNIKNDNLIKHEIQEEIKQVKTEDKSKTENLDGFKRGRKVIKTETGFQEKAKDLSSNIDDSSTTNLPQMKRKRRRGKNSEITDSLISTSSTTSTNSMGEISGTVVSKRGRKSANLNNYAEGMQKKRM